MALPTEAEWGVRSGGNDLNGAGFKSVDGGSVNYVHQDAAELSPTDLATPGAGSTTLTSATGGFTAAMTGNFIFIDTGTNFTQDYYQIATYVDTNEVTLDRSPTPGGAGGGDGEGKVGGSRATLTDAALEQMSADDTMYIEGGATYTPGGAINVAQGGGSKKCRLIGYTTTPGDTCRDANRPIIEMAANGFMYTGTHWKIMNLKVNMDDAVGLRVTANTIIRNVTVEKDINNSNSRCFYSAGTDNHLIDCEGYSIQVTPKGRGVENLWDSVQYCEFYDLEEGIDLAMTGALIFKNVIRDCTQIGIDVNADAMVIQHNTIDGNATGIDVGGNTSLVIMNNQITHNTTVGINASADQSELGHNNYHGNTADVSGITKEDDATSDDPGYANEGGDDFSEVDDANSFEMLRGVS
jgi:hypothetical protein